MRPFSGPAAIRPCRRKRAGAARATISPDVTRGNSRLFDDGWDARGPAAAQDEVFTETPKTIITRNELPDISFDRSINPYRGCEHGCVYCYARPTHAYMGLSPGLDFESKLFAKTNAAELLRARTVGPRLCAARPSRSAPTPIPISRSSATTASRGRCWKCCREFNHPVGIVTKSALVVRDLDILKPMAERGLVKVAVSVTTLDPKLARAMEPRAATPAEAARRARNAVRGRHSHRRHGGADHPGGQ